MVAHVVLEWRPLQGSFFFSCSCMAHFDSKLTNKRHRREALRFHKMGELITPDECILSSSKGRDDLSILLILWWFMMPPLLGLVPR